MSFGIIYIATNKINGKQYVGQTNRSLNKRINEHITDHNNTHFDYALNKYGLDNFYIFKIEYPKDELNYWEKYYIEMFNTFNTTNGYNHTTGGENYERSETTKKKLSIAKSGENNPMFGKFGKDHPMFGKHHKQEAKDKISIAHSGENNYLFGKPFPRDHNGEHNTNAKLNNNKIEHIKLLLWENILNYKEIGEMFGVTPSVICNIAHNKTWKLSNQ
jgi:group I intron endonuclease